MKPKLFGKQNCVSYRLIEFCGNFLIGVNGVSVAGKRADFHIVFLYERFEFFKLFFVCKKLLGICVSVAGEAAAAYLDHFNAERLEIFK